MARLSPEIGLLLLDFRITSYFDYVTSTENVADVFSSQDSKGFEVVLWKTRLLTSLS